MIKPQRLKPNSLIGLVAPASSPADASQLQKGLEMLERLGFRVRQGRHLLDSHGYLAGPDEARAEDLNEMFADEAVRSSTYVPHATEPPACLPTYQECAS